VTLGERVLTCSTASLICDIKNAVSSSLIMRSTILSSIIFSAVASAAGNASNFDRNWFSQYRRRA